MAHDDLSQHLSDLDRSLSSIEAVADLEKLRTEIGFLEEEVAAPDLWDDQDNAQRVTSQLSTKQGEVDRTLSCCWPWPRRRATRTLAPRWSRT